jgi:hypothetical protein
MVRTMPFSGYGSTFTPQDLQVMTEALAEAMRRLASMKRTDVTPDLVARKIVALAKQGERDPVKLCDAAVKSLTDDGAPKE